MFRTAQSENAESQRTQSFQRRTTSALSASPRFKTAPAAYEDIPGFCKSASLDEIAERGYVLTRGRYVGAEEMEDDGVPFAEKMEGLTRELATQFHESEKLQSAIRDNEELVNCKVTTRHLAA